MNIINADFLSHNFTDMNSEYYDMIVGNPPYFEFTLSNELKKKYKDVISGRVNIYTLFIKKSIILLKPKGIFKTPILKLNKKLI